MQLAVTVPTAVFDDTKATAPVGMFVGVVVSLTVAVQVECPVGTIVPGLQATAVDVVSSAAALTKVAPWSVSGITAAPDVIRTQSVVPVILWPEQLAALDWKRRGEPEVVASIV
jgi:hypothetical protein